MATKKVENRRMAKRLSKAKMKRDMVSENTNATEKIVVKAYASPGVGEHVCTAEKFLQFQGKSKKVYSAIIKKPSLQKKGYSVISAGQQVMIEDFGAEYPKRITAMDGRVGVYDGDFKPLLFK